MSQIITIVLQVEGEHAALHYFISDGLSPQRALAALQAVESAMQEALIEAEVRKRVETLSSPDGPLAAPGRGSPRTSEDLRRENVDASGPPAIP